MANLIKIGPVFINLDQIQSVVDLFPTEKHDKLIVRFGAETFEFMGREADDLRTWLNSAATNLQTPSDLDTRG